MNKSKSVRWGVIGLGWFGEVHADNLAEMPDIELTALCTRRPERLAEIADRLDVEKRYTDYQQLLADPDVDAVSVTTHFYDHRQITIDALRAGKYVLLEKPMAPTVADCDHFVVARLGLQLVASLYAVVRGAIGLDGGLMGIANSREP